MSEPKIYRKKSVEVQAMQVPEYADVEANDDLSDWLGDQAYLDEEDEFVIMTLEGEMRALTGDYIIKGVNGEFYPCKPDIFAKTYEEVQQMSIATDEAPIHDDPIPMYAQLDIWAALHAPEDVDPAEYDAFRAEHGYADTWAELCAAVRTVARGAGYITVRTAEPTEAEIEAAAKAYVLHHIDFTRFIEDSDGNTNMQPCSCGKEFPNKNTRLRHILHELLLAARKAVTA